MKLELNGMKMLVAFVGLLLVAASANAASAVRIWQHSAGEGFPSFYASMQKNGWTDERGINVDGLRTIAFGYAEKHDLVESADKQSYIKLFQQWNGLTGEYVSVEAFKAKGSGTGYWIASIEEMQQAVSAAVKAPKADANAEVLKLQEEIKILSLKGGKSHEEVTFLKSRLEALNAEVKARNEGNSKFKSGIQSTVDSMNRSIKALQNGEFTGAMGNAVDERVQGKVDTAVAPLMTAIDAQNTSINAVGSTVAAFDERVQKMEKAMKDSPLLAWGNNIFYAAGAFAFFLAAVVALNWRRTTAVKQEVGKEVAKVNDRVSVVEEQVGGKVDVDLATLSQIVELVKQQNKRGVGSLQRLLTIGAEAYTLRFIYTTPGYVKVEGIKDQTEPVKNDNLKSVILRAAGSGRIEGVSEQFSMKGDEIIVTKVQDVCLQPDVKEPDPVVFRHRITAAA